MKKLTLYLIALLSIIPSVNAQDNFHETFLDSKPVKTGDIHIVNISTDHPYKSDKAKIVFEREFKSEDASYIKLHFEDFNLAPGDYVEIYCPKTEKQVIYAGKGKIVDEHLTMVSNFWSDIFFSDKIILKLHTAKASSGYGFNIKKIAYGYTKKQKEKIQQLNSLKICGENDQENIKCYQNTEIYNKARAVCQIDLGDGTRFCTGWLLGCEGHLITNNHCINSAEQAKNATAVFDYMTEDCSGGKITRTTTYNNLKFIKTSGVYDGLDYTLLKIDKAAVNKYGYLSFSTVPPSVGERIYIPQHSNGYEKKVTVKDDMNDTGFAIIDRSSNKGVRYLSDTSPGGSGAPVINYNNNLVVALHANGHSIKNECIDEANGARGRNTSLIEHIGDDMPDCGINNTNDNSSPVSKFQVIQECKTVSFLNHSYGGGTMQYSWNFGDGNSSTELNPTYTYNKTGDYTVTLEVSNENGVNTTKLPIKIVEANSPENASKGVCKGEDVTVKLKDSPNGDYIWYDQPIGGNILATGNILKATAIENDKNYYVSGTANKLNHLNLGPSTIDQSQGSIETCDSPSGENKYETYGLIFDAKKDFILNSVKVLADKAGVRTIKLRNHAGVILKTIEVDIPTGENTIDLNLKIKAGNDLELSIDYVDKCGLFKTELENDDKLPYPYELENGDISIKSSTIRYQIPARYYFFFYNWDISVIDNCETTERAKIEVKVVDKPAIPTLAFNKTTNTLLVQENYKNYQWYLDGKTIDGATSKSYIALKTGTYHSEVSNLDGCNAISKDYIIDKLSNKDFELPNGVLVYPNPTANTLNINGLNKISDQNYIELVNLLGQTITAFNTTFTNKKLDVSNVSKGLYFLRINSKYIIRFIKN